MGRKPVVLLPGLICNERAHDADDCDQRPLPRRVLSASAPSVNLDHAKRHYYESHRTINSTGIVPKGPILDFAVPHDRAELDPHSV